MPQNIPRLQIICIRQPCQQFDQTVIGLLGKLPVVVFIAALYGYGILIAALHRVGYFIHRDDLQYLAFDPYDKMGAGPRYVMVVLKVLKIIAVVRSNCWHGWRIHMIWSRVIFCGITTAAVKNALCTMWIMRTHGGY